MAKMQNIDPIDARKQELLTAVIREYVKTALPVGSVTLVEKYGFDLSPATIRNELAALEELGLIEQPHTSAGRIPSEQGFQLFVDGLLSAERSAVHSQTKKIRLPDNPGADKEEVVKSVAKHVAEQAGEAVIVAFHPHHLYYTGLSHLFSQPEFQEFSQVVHFGGLIDRLDDIVGEVFPRVEKDIAIWLGRRNPFGNHCGTVIVQCAVGRSEKTGVMAILGPLRMDYERSFALLHHARTLLEEVFH